MGSIRVDQRGRRHTRNQSTEGRALGEAAYAESIFPGLAQIRFNGRSLHAHQFACC